MENWGLDKNWEQFSLCVISHMMFPFLPLLFEYWKTSNAGANSLTIATAMYAMSIGVSSQISLITLICGFRWFQKCLKSISKSIDQGNLISIVIFLNLKEQSSPRSINTFNSEPYIREAALMYPYNKIKIIKGSILTGIGIDNLLDTLEIKTTDPSYT